MDLHREKLATLAERLAEAIARYWFMCRLMYDSRELNNNNKDNNNSNLEQDDDEKPEEQGRGLRQQQEQYWAFKLFIEYPELYLRFLEQGKEKDVREVEGLCKISDEYMMPKASILDFEI